MTGLRRRLASCALALTVLQLAVLFSAPVRACCQGATSMPANASHACCVRQAAHPAGCPMHDAETPRNECRLSCDAQTSPYFLLGAVGLLPPGAPLVGAPASTPYLLQLRAAVRTLLAVPDAPPPRLL